MKTAVMAIMLLGIGELLVGQKPFDTPNLPPTRMRATIENGYSLRDDGRGAYVDDSDFAVVRSNQSFAIAAWKFIDWLSNKPDPTAGAEKVRSIAFDLGRPIASSGAKQFGIVADNLARFHVFWRHDHADNPKVREFIHRFEEVGPTGTTEKSSRVEMWVRVNGRQHVLQMGPWAMGEFSPRAKLTGKGTSEAVITRTSQNTWTITATRGSIARLWDYQDIRNPIDMGLYYFDFQVVATKL
jgi:hypothetical protein